MSTVSHQVTDVVRDVLPAELEARANADAEAQGSRAEALEARAVVDAENQRERVERLLSTFDKRVADMVRVIVPMELEAHARSLPVA
jgi:hypothetical protein